MAFKRPLPEWNNPGVEPPQSKKDMGWLGREKPPAQWHNWFQHLTYEALKELQENAAHVTFGNTPPDSPDVNDLWVDTSEEPPILKRFDGTQWVEIGKGGVSSVNGKTGDVELTAEDVGAASLTAFNTHLNDDTAHGIDTKVSKSGDAMTGTLNITSTFPLNLKLSGRKTWGFHRNGDNLYMAPSISNDGTDLDWGKQTVFYPDGKVSFSGIVDSKGNTSYTVRQFRNIILSTSDPNVSAMQDGDLWVKYKP